MSIFKVKNLEDNSVIEIFAMNIDNDNNILIKEWEIVAIIKINDFKDMLLGSTDGKNVTHKIID